MYSYFNPAHKWHYLSQQRPDEALIMKMFDSDPTVKATSKSQPIPPAVMATTSTVMDRRRHCTPPPPT